MSKFELKDVRVTDGFFSDYAELVRTEVIPYQWEALNDRIPGAEKSGCIHNFRIAAGEEEGEFVGMVFQDSDLGKWLEAVAYSLTTHPDKKLEAIADDGAIKQVVQAVLDEHEAVIAQYKAGDEKVYGFFIGQCMRRLQGKADPVLVNKLVKEEIAHR